MTSADASIAGKKLLILGGGLWQMAYVRRARELGVETWVTDWSPDAVAKTVADHFATIDLKDRDATLALAREARFDGVLTAADIGVPTAAYLCERLRLPGYGSDVAELATNKFRMRERARAVGIAGPWYRRVRSSNDVGAIVGADEFPVILKPVDNCSSRGVRWVGTPDDLPSAVAAALDASRIGEALVEQCLVGAEGSVEALVQRGRAIVLGACDKTKSPLPDRFDLELRYPAAFAPEAWRAIEALPQQVATGYGVADGILHIEFLVERGTNRVCLIEFAIRGCGSKVVTDLMPALTGVDVVHVLIRQAFGLTTRVEPVVGRHGALRFLMFPCGRVAAVHGVAAARCVPGVIDVCIERRPGDRIDDVHDGRSRPGHLLVHADDRAGVQAIVADVCRLVRVEYDDGRVAAPLPLVDREAEHAHS